MMFCIDCGCIIANGSRCCNCSRIYYKSKKVIRYDADGINFGERRSNWNNTMVREHNLMRIIKSLKEGSKSHNEICKDIGLGRSSIRRCIDQLIREGIVIEETHGSMKCIRLRSEYDARELQAAVV